jgi:hypothetical protein
MRSEDASIAGKELGFAETVGNSFNSNSFNVEELADLVGDADTLRIPPSLKFLGIICF